ncbi:MAG: long-chain-acyl-CoA synthetase [Myxococcota bacterium]|nr:long-chain-acyl-CoA synthetase [Myxococcota bacterium]
MPSYPSPTSFAARRSAIAGLTRIATCLPLFVPNSTWNSSRLLARNALRNPEGLAIAFEDRRYSWAELDREVNRYAQALRKLGVAQGDVVALLMDNRPEFLMVLTAIARLRATSALINTNITGVGLVHAIRISKAKRVLVGIEHESNLREILGELEEIEAGDALGVGDGPDSPASQLPAFEETLAAVEGTPPSGVGDSRVSEHFTYIYTSGTTGLPKAAIISHAKLLTAGSLFGRGIYNARSGDVIYSPLPLYHSSAMFGGWMAALISGAAYAFRRKFSATKYWDDVRKFGATHLLYIGELCRYLLNQPVREGEREHNVRIASGNGLRPDIWETFQERFGIPLIREFYGATEGNLPTINFAGIPGMVGRINPGQTLIRCDLETGDIYRNAEGHCEAVKEGETGLLLMRISKIAKFDGYLDKAASNKKILEDAFEEGDRHFNSGDLLTLHAGNWLSFADRIGDTFRWKGENVSTNEVAEALNSALGILETNVYGVEVPGADGRAGMASLNVSDEFSLDAFTEHVQKNLPVYQRPYFLRIQHDMRITGTFKHQKVDYRKEGFDPGKVNDPMYFLDGDKYVPLDAMLFESLQSGSTTLR